MPKTQITLDQAAITIADTILRNLKYSAFNDFHPEAYKELLKYRQDIKADVRRALRGKTIFEEG